LQKRKNRNFLIFILTVYKSSADYLDFYKYCYQKGETMWHLFVWRDASEILFFTFIFYTSALWLKKDKQHNLLGYAVAYGFFVLLCYLLQLQTINSFLFLYSPVIMILFLLVHQDTLQKNFVASFAASSTPTQELSDWLEMLFSTCLSNIHQTKSTHCLIEHQDNLAPFLHNSFTLNTSVAQELLHILCTSDSYDDQKMIWLTTSGILKGINSSWNYAKSVAAPYPTAAKISTDITLEQAVAITTKTDAIFFCCQATTRLFTVVIGDTLFKKISAHHAQQIIKKHIAFVATKKGISYAKNKTDFKDQQTS
jgi:hypothetical protein